MAEEERAAVAYFKVIFWHSRLMAEEDHGENQ
jgi:hypothetical protein